MAAATILLAATTTAAHGRCRTLDPHQNQVLRVAHDEAHRLGANYRIQIALIEAGWVESRMRNLNYGHADSLGYLQQRPSMGWPHPRHIRTATRSFITRAKPIAHRYATAGALAQAVQRSAYPHRYHQARWIARRLHRCVTRHRRH